MVLRLTWYSSGYLHASDCDNSVSFGDRFVCTKYLVYIVGSSPHVPSHLQCFCGVFGDGPTRLGLGTCTRSCAGDDNEICGGSYAINVYTYGDVIIDTPIPLGCYRDETNDRIMTRELTDDNMTNDVSAIRTKGNMLSVKRATSFCLGNDNCRIPLSLFCFWLSIVELYYCSSSYPKTIIYIHTVLYLRDYPRAFPNQVDICCIYRMRSGAMQIV